MAKSMYDIIKKQNGEHFAKAIRNYDNGIFDVPNIDKIVKYAGPDAEPIMNYLVSLKNIQIEEHAVHQDPIKLLDLAGYDAYIADTLEKQNAIKNITQAAKNCALSATQTGLKNTISSMQFVKMLIKLNEKVHRHATASMAHL